MTISKSRIAISFACLVPAVTACVAPSGGSLGDPTEPFREIGGAFKRMADGALSIESVGLVGPLREVRAEDGSFVLTQTPTSNVPFYSNTRGPVQTRYLVSSGWRQSQVHSVPVQVMVEGRAESLHGRLAIFPAANVDDSHRIVERFHARITVTPESLAQMERGGTGFSCVHYTFFMQDWCDWALWISRSPIPQ